MDNKLGNQYYKLKTSFFSLLTLFFISCQTDSRLEGAKEAVEKMKSMQIKRVTNTQVVTIVDDWGQRIVKQAQAQLEMALKTPKTDNAQLCRLGSLSQIDSLEKLYSVKIDLLGTKDAQNPTLSAKEQELIGAYLYNAQNHISQITNIQKLGDSVLIYNAPVATDNIICQKCFADDATKLGVWRVKFLKNEVIRKVNTKSLQKKRKD
ncbi:MAG: hypothetical protein R2822_01135 [Spirosomataceae bacterium]